MQTIHVVGAAIRNGSKILAAQRSPLMKTPLKWEFVGGKVEKGETHEQALKREVMEELGIKIKVNGYVATGQTVIEDREILLHVYEAEIVDGVPVAREHSRLDWMDIREIEGLDWAQPDIPACKELIERYG